MDDFNCRYGSRPFARNVSLRNLTKFFLFFIVFNLAFTNAYARTFNFLNRCSFPVWFGFVSGANNTSPQPGNNNYRLEANGGTNVVTIPAGIWSGVIAGRTNCTSAGCETADCGGGTGACTRGFMQPATQAEFTVNATGTDFYDVEVINGVNLPVSVTPSRAAQAGNPYFCGSPGAASPSPGLGACSWQFSPPLVEYQWVVNGGAACSSNSNCPAGTLCGLSFNPGQTPLLKKTCGRLLGYWSADQICGVQRNYGAPFNCSQSLPAPQNNLTWWNLFACVGVGSCYQPGAGTNCCGCVNWDSIGLPVPPGPLTEQCRNRNSNWVNGVLPTLTWLKRACPSSYVYPYDDMSSTYTCNSGGGSNQVNYTITFCPSGQTPPPTDTGNIRVVSSSGSDARCLNASDTLFIDQNPGVPFNTTTGVTQTVAVGSHQLRLTSQTSIPAGNNQPGSCRSTLSQTQVQVVRNVTTQVTATYQYTNSPPPGNNFAYNVRLGFPFLRVTINNSIICPDASGNPVCLIRDQAVGSNMTIRGQSNHLCSLAIQSNGSVTINAGSIYCFINSIPATPTQPGSISLPSQF